MTYSFDDNGGNTQTANAQRYGAVLAKFWRALKSERKNDPETLHCQWF